MTSLFGEYRQAVEALLVRYATAADTRDMPLLASCFTEDVEADYGAGIGAFAGRDALIAHLGTMLDACGPTLHFISNVVIAGDGPVLRSRCYTQAVVTIPGVEVPIRTAGSYDDELRRGTGEWRIARRVYTALA